MNNDDRDYLRLLEKKMDEQHGALVTLVTTEFERASRHMSKQNDRTTSLEEHTILARWVQNNPGKSIIIGLITLFAAIVTIDVVGVADLIELIK